MHILIVVHGYPPTFKGGAELRAERTARGLAGRQHDVAVLSVELLSASETRLVSSDQLREGVRVHQLHVKELSDLGDGYHNHSSKVVQSALEQLINERRPDVIHLFSGYLMGTGVIDTAVAHQIPVTVSLTDYWWLCHRINLVQTNGTRCNGPSPLGCARCHSESYRRFRIPAHAVRPLVDGLWQLAELVPVLGASLGVPKQANRLRAMLAALDKAAALIAPSKFLADTYIRHGVNEARIHVWRQGVNLRLCPQRRPSPTLRFGYFGQIKHHKGIHTLIEAWGTLHTSRQRSLAIYGSAHGEEAYAAQLQKITASMEDVSWHQAIAHADVWQVLAETDVLIVPSRWFENSPNVILEAQAMGVTIIGTNLGGIAELVHHGRNGLLFEADNAASLAEQMRRLLDDPELLAELRRSPIPFHSFVDELDQIEGLYARLKLLSADRDGLGPDARGDRSHIDASYCDTPVELG